MNKQNYRFNVGALLLLLGFIWYILRPLVNYPQYNPCMNYSQGQ